MNDNNTLIGKKSKKKATLDKFEDNFINAVLIVFTILIWILSAILGIINANNNGDVFTLYTDIFPINIIEVTVVVLSVIGIFLLRQKLIFEDWLISLIVTVIFTVLLFRPAVAILEEINVLADKSQPKLIQLKILSSKGYSFSGAINDNSIGRQNKLDTYSNFVVFSDSLDRRYRFNARYSDFIGSAPFEVSLHKGLLGLSWFKYN